MLKIFLFTLSFLILLSCRRKHTPERTLPETSVTSNVIIPKKSDSVVVRKKVYKPTKKDIIPDVIVVNEKAARRSVDGRYYYDLIGHRYWRNNKDGKYYLFNKSMYSNDDFKAPAK
jgi:hypothetical protein